MTITKRDALYIVLSAVALLVLGAIGAALLEHKADSKVHGPEVATLLDSKVAQLRLPGTSVEATTSERGEGCNGPFPRPTKVDISFREIEAVDVVREYRKELATDGWKEQPATSEPESEIHPVELAATKEAAGLHFEFWLKKDGPSWLLELKGFPSGAVCI